MFDDFLDLFDMDDDQMDVGTQIDQGEGTPMDLNGDGIIDAIRYEEAIDIDGDGIADGILYEDMLDLDGDGVIDSIQDQTFLDTDGDGILDQSSVTLQMDTDGDGQADYLFSGEDYDGDSILDANDEWFDQDGDGYWDMPDDNGADIEAGAAPTYITFDADDADTDDIVGDPESAMDDWHWQETDSSCAVASQEFVLQELTGQEFDEADLRDLAEQNGWWTLEGGTPMDDVGNILEYMGLNVERSGGNSIADIEACLENGGGVIVGVDSSEIWEGENDDVFGPGIDADHAVQVIGIDYSDPDNPMVILNDPGTSNGGGAMIPMDVFEQAWEDSGCFMVEAYA